MPAGNGHLGQALEYSRLHRPATLNKLGHVIPEAEFVKLKRLMAWARTHGMVAIYLCPLCEQQIKLTWKPAVKITDGTAPNYLEASTAECSCRRWIIR